MVVFTCGHCGESVQKPKVEKHYLTKCRNRNPNLSCMDCFKDFLGKDYEAHIKCITEEQRYSGKGFVAKEKKGEKKQNTWVEMLQSLLEEQLNAPKNVLRIIEAISKHNNTPRKKPKFINFVKNVCGPKTNPKDIEQAWDLISIKLSALSIANSSDNNKNLETSTNNVTDEIQQNEDRKEENQQNCTIENGDSKLENGENLKNGSADEHNGDFKKLSKKQRKEEKKRQKYEADLKSAAELPKELEETHISKKDKKKKNKINSTNGGTVDETQTEAEKNKKRKRQDTVNSLLDVELENGTENNENEPVNKEKKQKKKLKLVRSEELDESVCLHDQNVAKSEQCEEKVIKNDKFNWHAVILSVLEKKGNELPFKRLQKKVLGEYSEATGLEVDDRIADKFIKKLKSAPNVRVDKNRVFIEE